MSAIDAYTSLQASLPKTVLFDANIMSILFHKLPLKALIDHLSIPFKPIHSSLKSIQDQTRLDLKNSALSAVISMDS